MQAEAIIIAGRLYLALELGIFGYVATVLFLNHDSKEEASGLVWKIMATSEEYGTSLLMEKNQEIKKREILV